MFIAVNLEREQEQIPEVLAIVQQLGMIAKMAKVVPVTPKVRQAGAIVLEIPQDRVLELILALQSHGFSNVWACEADPTRV
jgi:hypothetical protein